MLKLMCLHYPKLKLPKSRTMKKFLFFISILMWGTATLFAQRGLITGTVLEENGTSIVGATVAIEGKTIGTITGADGEFALDGVSVGDVVVFSFVGMETQRIEVTSLDQVMNVTMLGSLIDLDEVVIVGYGEQKKESVVGAIGVAKSDEIRTQGNVSNLKDALTGAIPGLSVLTTSGLAGGGDDRITRETEMLIRGRTTWNDASPLILVDGVERDDG